MTPLLKLRLQRAKLPVQFLQSVQRLALLAWIAMFILSACSPLQFTAPVSPELTPEPTQVDQALAPLPPQPLTEITFRMEAPAETPTDAQVFLTVLDEVTGLALNTEVHAMEPSEAVGAAGPVYELTLPMAVGSVVRYRYERQAEGIRVAEHTSDGRQVRYRLVHVAGPGSVTDVVSRWTDTPFTAQVGRIMGKVTDAADGQPIPNLLIAAGGQQTYTAGDGSFLLEGLPPGIHNLVALALDGRYQIFQQGAKVDPHSTTPAEFTMNTARLVNVVFVVRPPENTPPLVALRLAGNLAQLGNTFADLAGGSNGLATRMPVMEVLPDGRYTLTLVLPAGADVRYKYTLGDGFWNAEHTTDGAFRLRQMVVPEYNVLIQDEIETWQAGVNGPITFDVTVPADTPPEDFISLQFNPLFGWMEPVPMWQLEPNRWAYVLYSPLDLPGALSYRYCRNGQCGRADDAATPGLYGQGRPVTVGVEPQEIRDQVDAWADFAPQAAEAPALGPVEIRGVDFWAGVEFEHSYHPSWHSRMPSALEDVQSLGANWLVAAPTWTYGGNDRPQTAPVLEPIAGRNALWADLVETVGNAKSRGLNVALFPAPLFPTEVETWWQEAPRDFGWWLVWFHHYTTFVTHHAALAEQTQAEALILGGDWLRPALPEGTVDGKYSGVPSDADGRWRALLASARSRYSGKIYWATTAADLGSLPAFVSDLDGIYLLLDSAALPDGVVTADPAVLETVLAQFLDTTVAPIQSQFGKPLVLALSAASGAQPIPQEQVYQSVLNLTAQRPWISGFVARGYFPPAVVHDASPSIHGKPAADLLRNWFPQATGAAAQ